MNDTGSFGKYGKVFQEKIFQCLVADTTWASQIIEVMTPNFFEQKYLEYLTKCYFTYFEKYKSFPTMPLLITIVRDELQEGSDLILST